MGGFEPFHSFKEIGERLAGTLIGMKTINGQDRSIFNITNRGPVVLPSHVMLHDFLEDITPGTSIIVECTGEQDIAGRGQPMKTYNAYETPQPAPSAPGRDPDDPAGGLTEVVEVPRVVLVNWGLTFSPALHA